MNHSSRPAGRKFVAQGGSRRIMIVSSTSKLTGTWTYKGRSLACGKNNAVNLHLTMLHKLLPAALRLVGLNSRSKEGTKTMKVCLHPSTGIVQTVQPSDVVNVGLCIVLDDAMVIQGECSSKCLEVPIHRDHLDSGIPHSSLSHTSLE